MPNNERRYASAAVAVI